MEGAPAVRLLCFFQRVEAVDSHFCAGVKGEQHRHEAGRGGPQIRRGVLQEGGIERVHLPVQSLSQPRHCAGGGAAPRT
jgi:hypothetical protein